MIVNILLESIYLKFIKEKNERLLQGKKWWHVKGLESTALFTLQIVKDQTSFCLLFFPCYGRSSKLGA